MNKIAPEWIRIDRRSGVAITEQIRLEFQNAITSRKIPVGSIIENLSKIAATIGVKDDLVKDVFQQLCDSRYLTQISKTSYRVTFIELSNDLKKPFYVIVDQIIDAGMSLSIHLLERKILYPTEELSQRTGFPVDERLLYLKRMYYGDQIAFLMGEHFVPLRIFPDFEHKVKGNERIYQLMEETNDIQMHTFHRIAEACTMDSEMGQLFSAKVGSPYVQVSSKMYDQYQRQIEFSTVSLISNYSIQLHISRDDLFR